jgi:hypothetical protein
MLDCFLRQIKDVALFAYQSHCVKIKVSLVPPKFRVIAARCSPSSKVAPVFQRHD